MTTSLITTTADLAALCDRLSHEPWITIDTEFVRERTYYPVLCLVQLAAPEGEAFLIDPLAPGIDLAPLYALLQAPPIKVFHACRQDVEIFFTQSGQVPTPLFDTQIAAMVCGFGEQAGYESLVVKLLKQSVDKSSRFTDWARRPLSDKQLTYAAADVTHLRDVYRKLLAELERSGRSGWIAEDMAALQDTSCYAVDPETAWQKLRYRSATPKFLAQLKALAAWREREAQRANVPRSRLAKDEALLELAATAPATVEELRRMRGMEGQISNKHAETLVALMAEVKAADPATYPRVPEKPMVPPEVEGAMELLRVLLNIQCGKHRVAPKLLGTREDLEGLLTGDPHSPLTHGWRYEIFGRHAGALLAGRLALTWDGRKVAILQFEDELPPAAAPNAAEAQ